jgi:cytochrome c553
MKKAKKKSRKPRRRAKWALCHDCRGMGIVVAGLPKLETVVSENRLGVSVITPMAPCRTCLGAGVFAMPIARKPRFKMQPARDIEIRSETPGEMS